MREVLKALSEAGIRRARFQAQFSGLSARGHSILNNVLPPVGAIDHLWIRQALKAERGDTVHFLASIQPYQHDSAEPDFTLSDIELIG